MSEAEHGSRNIPLNTNLISVLILKLYGLPIKTGKLVQKKELSYVSMSTMERLP